MWKRFCLLALCGAPALFGWGCEGHQAVALIAEKNLTPRTLAFVQAMLDVNPIDPALVRYCVQNRDDLMADASTWADDIRRTAGTGKWHYMDIPRQETGGDPAKWCEDVGPAAERGERAGCVLAAIAYNRDILRNPQNPGQVRADALRYLIHLAGDIHQPLHTTDNHDQGGNCAPMVLLDAASISNLHSIWDSGLLEQHLRDLHQTVAQYAASLNQRFAAEKAKWAPSPADVNTWVWESHAAGNRVTFGAIEPPIPMEPETGKTDCNAESAKVYALHVHLNQAYLNKATPVIDEQIAKAGFRLAEMLNEIIGGD